MMPRGIARQIFLGYVLPLIVLLVAGLLIPILLWGFAGRYRGEFAARKELASRMEVLAHAAMDVAEAEANLKRFKDPAFRSAQNQARSIYRDRYQEIMSWFEDHPAPALAKEFRGVHAQFQVWDRKGSRAAAAFEPIKATLVRLTNQTAQARDRYEPLYLTADSLRVVAIIIFPLGALVSALMIGRSIARSITEPLEALVSAVERLERKEITPAELPDESGRDDEVGELWQALRRMAETVAERESTLEARSKALAVTGRRLESVLDATNDGVALLSREGRFLLANPRFAAFFGMESEDLQDQNFARIGPRLLSLFKGSDQEPARLRLREVLRDTERVADETFALARPLPRVLRFYSSPVRTEGTLIGRIVILRDVTRETEADRLKSEFASTVSHELRTPLTAISGNVALLLSEKPGSLTEDQREFLALTQISVLRLTGLITEMLDLSKLESTGLQMEHKPLDCGLLARQVVRTMEEQARTRGLSLTLNMPESIPIVRGDTDRIAQVLMNLISNALKYTPSGGKVVVRLAADDTQLTVRVADTGIGITAEDRARLFDKFFRADNSTTRNVGGTGLGLAISKTIVEALGGTIWVESTPGIGSTFAFTLPLAGTEPEKEAPEELASPTGPRRLLLLVHDQTPILHRLNHTFSNQGMIVSAAAVPDEALRRARGLHPDALLLPPLTATFDSFQLLRHLRADPQTERVTVLIYALRAVGNTYELRDSLLLSLQEKLASALSNLKTDEHARNRPVVIVGDEALFQATRDLWPRQSASPLLWCSKSEELVSKVGPLCPLAVVCDTTTQDMRPVGAFSRGPLERHSNQRVAWLYLGDFGSRTRLLVPHGAGSVSLERSASVVQEAISAAI
ncbi:ATP-binding protein [Armatimonas sp.]|uniref:ATP-binding protein n=1 Tax=Armatimonas sp. TaxID=1872638 RepID=UPI00286D635B|nr:ATP-binding protein [Armatimonas sp.]